MVDIPVAPRPPVFIVDDDADLLDALRAFLASEGWVVEIFSSISTFLNRVSPADPGLLLLDVEFPDATGVDLQTYLTALGDLRPIIFMTGHEKVSVAVDAMKGGATEFLIKPFREEALLQAVDKAAASEIARVSLNAEQADLKKRFDALTPRERQVMEHVVTGKLNKQIAGEMSLAEITVKVHRSRVMQKMKVSSVAALVRLCDRLPMSG